MQRRKYLAISTEESEVVHAEDHQQTESTAGVWETALAIYEKKGRFQSITVKCGVDFPAVDNEIRSLGLPFLTLEQHVGANSSCMATTGV